MKTYSIDEYMPAKDRKELVKSVLCKHGINHPQAKDLWACKSPG